MHCTLTRTDGTSIHTPLTVTPTRYSHAAQGGPDTAELRISGDKNALADVLNWLACHVTIYSASGLPVWWGLVQAATVTLDGVEYGLDASEIVNRMAVIYTAEDGSRAQTTWVEDAHSIALYGRREVRESLRADNATTALGQATRYVNERSAPLRSVRAGSGGDGAKLSCIGYWRTLDWRYWSQAAGQQLQDEDANVAELLGFSVAGADIGFYRSHSVIGRITADLYPLLPEDRIKVSGSAANNGVYEVAEGDGERTAQLEYTSDGIYFDAADDVHDTHEELNQFREHELVLIADADNAANNGYFFVKKILESGEHMTVTSSSIVDEGANTVTIKAGNMLLLTAKPPATELPGASITLAGQAVKIAQAFTTGPTGAWELSEVWLQAARIGSPSDALKIEVCADSGGAPGSVLKSATVTGADMQLLEFIDWQQWLFDSTQSLAASTLYWVVVSRTGAGSADAYRVSLLQAEEGLSAGNLLLWDGSSWVARTVASGLGARLALRVYGQRVTTTQIEDIAAGVGEWLTAAGTRTASGLRTRLYRSEEEAQTALSEIKALLEFGTSGGDRLLARVTMDRALLVDAQPSRFTPRYLWTRDGLRDRWGLALPEGELPVGEWVAFELAGVVDAFGPAFLEAAEYDAATGGIRASFRTEQPLQTLARLSRGVVAPDLAARLSPYLYSEDRGVSRVATTNYVRSMAGRPRSTGGGGGGSAYSDHGELSGLADDDHTQYAKLLGRAGGQNLYGGTGSSDFLNLYSYSGASARVAIDPSGYSLIRDGGGGTMTFTSFAASGQSTLQMRRALGSEASPTDVTSGQVLGRIVFQGYANGAFSGSRALLIAYTAENWSSSAQGTRWLLQSTEAGGTTALNIFSVDGSGNFRLFLTPTTAIGTSAKYVLAFGAQATAPSTSPADMIQLWDADQDGTAGNAALHLRGETGDIHVFGKYASLPGLVVNDGGASAANYDTRFESDTEANMFWLDASADELWLGGSTTGLKIAKGGGVTMADATNIALGTTTGTKFGTSTSQKLGFFNATPVVQPTALTAANASALNTGDATSDTVIGNMRTRIGEIETKLKALGLLA